MESLLGKYVQLIPMERSHIPGLYDCGKNGDIWRHLPKTIQTLSDMESLVEDALAKKESGTEFPFTILLRKHNKIIGSTRFVDISKEHKRLEIGWTWLTPSVWGTKVNTECKYLLLKYCFENLHLIRVQLKTDECNLRSQKAIERIGGVKEGIFRNHMIRKDGSFRNSVYYGIIQNEWPAIKQKLERILSSP